MSGATNLGYAAMSGTNERLNWVDSAKGISIILVVMMYSVFNVGQDAEGVGLFHYVIGFATPFRMPEFFLISQDGSKISDEFDAAEKPCYDQQALMRRYDVIAEICDHMLSLGWKPYQNDHEDATGQYEMNWKYDDVLATADKHSFFKFMMKSVAEKHGLRCTFMPKPFKGLTGSGCHAHISVWNLDGTKNAFSDPSKELSLSDQGRNFLGGIMKHASALAAICNPTVNSYKRINAPRTSSGAMDRSLSTPKPVVTP